MAYTDPSDLRTLPYCRYRVAAKENGISRKNWVKNYVSTKKILGHGWNDQNTAAGTNANPTLAWYWWIIFDTSDVAETVSITFDVKIAYYARVIRSGDNVNES